MEIGETLSPQDREAWRAWLVEHHAGRTDIWLVLYKASSGRRGLTLAEAQEEAMCFGWVDSLMKSIDADSYVLRFTPRRPKSHWTAGNKALALRLLRAGRLAPPGLAALPPDVLSVWEAENSG